ncbi:MAG: sugar phosphate isomerase/epimerase family protein, partial [Oscillospiraceae bacterium]
MKYGIYFAYWTREWFADYKKYIDKAAKLGFDILEISCAALRDVYTTREQLLELRDYAIDKGIVLTAGYGPTKSENLCSDDNKVVTKAMEFFKELLPKLQLLGVHVLGGGLYSYWPVDFSENNDKEGDRRRAIKNIKEVSKAAEDCDVILGLEVLNRYEGYILNTCDEAIEFVDEIGSTHVKIMLDTFHMNIEEDNMAAAIRRAGNRLGHLHLGENNRRVPGKGGLPWDEIGQALRDINYSGAA